MLIRLLYVMSLWLTSLTLWAQTGGNVWKSLADVAIEDRYDASVGYEVSYPVFGERAQVLDNQQGVVNVYMKPFEAYLKPKYFILSALPIAACFFCGGAGPETVMEVFSQNNIELSSEVIKLRGRLELNADNPDHMMYILHDAKLLED